MATKLDTWFKSALAKTKSAKEAQPHLTAVTQTAGLTFATDGYRMHFTRTGKGASSPLTKKLAETIALADSSPTTVTVTADHLASLCKQAKAFWVGGNPLTMSANGHLDLAIRNVEFGEWSSELHDGDEWPHWFKAEPWYRPSSVTYRKVGPDASVKVNPKYLLDALAGMSGPISIKINPNHNSVLLQCGEREAVIMGMN